MATDYALTTRTTGSFKETVDEVTAALSDEGFGVLSEIDVQAKMKEKLGRDMPPYLILGACAPPLAWDAVHAVPDVGVFLPCNVVVREDDEGVVVSAMNPESVMSMIDDAEVERIADEVRERLERVVASLD